eukprot:3158040-Rhodomonas_salina.2
MPPEVLAAAEEGEEDYVGSFNWGPMAGAMTTKIRKSTEVGTGGTSEGRKEGGGLGSTLTRGGEEAGRCSAFLVVCSRVGGVCFRAAQVHSGTAGSGTLTGQVIVEWMMVVDSAAGAMQEMMAGKSG